MINDGTMLNKILITKKIIPPLFQWEKIKIDSIGLKIKKLIRELLKSPQINPQKNNLAKFFCLISKEILMAMITIPHPMNIKSLPSTNNSGIITDAKTKHKNIFDNLTLFVNFSIKTAQYVKQKMAPKIYDFSNINGAYKIRIPGPGLQGLLR